MGHFTVVPVWIVEDILIYAATAAVVFYIIQRERHPISRLMEMIAFTLLDSAVYENFATVKGIYGYGRSSIMVFNVPLAVPLFEYLVLYASLKLFENMRMRTWLKPIGAGFLAVIADFTLDPVSVQQRFQTHEGLTGRWTWYIEPDAVQIYTEPVKNFTGWMIIIGWAALTALLGRDWFRRSGYKPLVGYAYPVVAAIAALVLTVSPISNFLLSVVPFVNKGGPAEWVMLGISLIAPPILFAIFWRGRMHSGYSFKQELPLFFVLGGFPVINVVFTIVGGYTRILWLELLFMIVMEAVLALLVVAGRRADRNTTGAAGRVSASRQ